MNKANEYTNHPGAPPPEILSYPRNLAFLPETLDSKL